MNKWKENMKNGCITGLILFFANILIISLFEDKLFGNLTGGYIVLILSGYLLAGTLLAAFRNREKKLDRSTYYGAAGFYWFIPILALISVFIAAVPVIIRWLALCDFLILATMWIIEYTYLCRMSKKLNKNISLVKDGLAIELPKKMLSADQVFDFLTEYCIQNKMNLVLDKREIPGNVEIDHKAYSISIQEYYGFFGMPTYDLLLTSVTLKDGRKG